MGDYFRLLKEHKKALLAKYGIECPECKRIRQNTYAATALPCRWIPRQKN